MNDSVVVDGSNVVAGTPQVDDAISSGPDVRDLWKGLSTVAISHRRRHRRRLKGFAQAH